MQIIAVNALDHADGIKALFTAHDTPQFASYFDRVYPGAGAGGARSWIGIEETGDLVMHMACFVNQFQLDGAPVRGGLLANFMVASRHRTVTPALTLTRQLVRDARAFGDLDFLYTNPNAASHAILGFAGLKPVAQVERLVYPTGDANPFLDLGTLMYQVSGQLRAGPFDQAEITRHPVDDAVGRTPSSASHAGRLTPLRTEDQLARRLPGFPADGDAWFTMERDGRAIAAFLLGTADCKRNVDLHAAWTVEGQDLSRLAPSVARRARLIGGRRLVAYGVAGSLLVAEMVRGGFKPRGTVGPLDAIALTAAGERALAAVTRWDMHGIDLDGGIA
jgi:hypothetical protein